MFASSGSSSPASSTQLPTDFSSLKSAVSQGGEHLGDVVYWMLSGADVPRSVLETKWLAHGLDKDFLPEEQTPEKAMRQAVREAMLGQDKKLVAIQPTVDSKSSLIYAIGTWTPDKQGNVEFKQDALVMLDKSVTPNVASSDNPSNDLVTKVLREYNRYLFTHTSRDVMVSITKALKAWDAVMLRETGGIYFVPRTQSENLRKLQGAVEQLGNSLVSILPQHSTADTVRSLSTAASGSIESELSDLRTEMEKFLSDPDGVRSSTLKNRLDDFQSLRSRASLYHTILHVTVEDLGTQLAQMEAQIKTMLSKKEDDRETAAEIKKAELKEARAAKRAAVLAAAVAAGTPPPAEEPEAPEATPMREPGEEG